jgi:SPP1 gp7 family putative phage head morphogenesis protein
MIKDIYNGSINVENLPIELYKSTANKLLSGVEAGAKIDYINFEFGELGKETALLLRENIYLFSGAKTFNYVLETQNLIIRDGKIIPYKEFEQLATAIDEKFNKRWLQVEWSDAQISAKNKLDWQNLQNSSEAFPLLRYVAFMDKNTSEICRRLNGIVKPTNDPFWNTYKPQNHYQCRCDLEPLQLNEAVETNLNSKDLIKPTPYFSNLDNDTIFNKLHPYFDVDNKYKAYAKNNFNLPIPKLNEPEIKKDNLTKNARLVKNEAEKFTGTKINETAFKFVNDELNVVKGSGYITPKCTKISFGSIEDPIKYKEKTVYHELGHITHIQTKQLYYQGNKLAYSEEFEQYLTLAKKELRTLDTEKLIDNVIKDMRANPDIRYNGFAFLDTIGDLKKGVKGYKLGHDQVYYKRMHGMETFAHLNENYFQGNEVFKKYLPKSYELGINYLKKIYGE